MTENARTRLDSQAESFLLDGQARGLAAGTLRFYGEKLRAFVGYLQGEGIEAADAITPGHIRRYLAAMQERGLKANTVHAHARAIRSFCNFLTAEGEMPESPMRRVKMPRTGKEILPAFTAQDVQDLLEACLNSRDKAIVLCLLDTGVRAREFLALNLGDVDLATGAVQVRQGKGGKGRVVYLGAKSRQMLQRYLRRRQDADHLTVTSALWTTRSGNRLRLSGLRQVLRRLGERSGVHCHPHRFRRTFALWSLRAGMDVYSLQRLMGHAICPC